MQVKFSKKFTKQFKKADSKVRSAFEKRLRLFVDSPDHPQLRNHRLTGQFHLYHSINVTGDWRALYSLDQSDEEVVCTFEMLGTHSQLYR